MKAEWEVVIFYPEVLVGELLIYLLDGRTDLRAERSLKVGVFDQHRFG